MEIGILTLPFNANYGGILQAWALQTALEQMGHHACHINSIPHWHLQPWLRPVAYAKRLAEQRLLGRSKRIRFEEFNNAICRNTNAFISRHIHLAPESDTRRLRPGTFDAIIVGSDQVWRRDFWRDITVPFLAFTDGWNLRRVAYAASFGLDTWRYDDGATARCAELLARFDLVSVREHSAQVLAERHLHRAAQLMPDPTMLLRCDDYRSLIAPDTPTPPSTNSLFAYVLGPSTEAQATIRRMADERHLTVSASLADDDISRPTEACIRPPLETWLTGIAGASLVVTNSFHGCVLAAIFQKPFTVLPYAAGGQTRIDSLVKSLGLNLADTIHDTAQPHVQQRLDAMRRQGLDFLRQATRPQPQT